MKNLEIVRKSKWTVAALINGKEVATAKSEPKLLEKLKELFPEKEGKRRSIRSRVIELMTGGSSNKEITATINTEFPKSKFNPAHTAWYRSTLVSNGVIAKEFSAVNMKRKLKGEKVK